MSFFWQEPMSKVLIYQQVHVAVEETVAVAAETLASKVDVTITSAFALGQNSNCHH